MSLYHKNDVVQFKDQHKWRGCFGTITSVKEQRGDNLYMIGVPVPSGGVAFILSPESKCEFVWIGKTSIVGGKEDE